MASSYCINALCEQRLNSINASNCTSCGASLLYQNRYRLIKKFRPDHISNQQTVYEGVDINSGESVIAKVVEIYSRNCPNPLRKEQEILASFPTEIYPKRVTSNDYFEFQPDLKVEGLTASMLILPKFNGVDSESWIEQHGTLDQEKAIAWINKVLPYLKQLSAMAVLHRDIKPTNIIVGEDESLTLIDYGAARKQDDEYMAIISGEVVDSSRNEYRKITRVFSAGYTAPEQNQGKPIPQSDFFSLGRTVIFWISGQSPDELTNLESNLMDWFKLKSPHKFDQCFLEFLEKLTHPIPTRRPLTLDEIETFINSRLPELIQIERQKNSKLSLWLRKGLFALGILGIVSVGWWQISRYFLAQGTQSIESNDYKRALQELRIARSLNPFSVEIIRQQAYAYLWSNDTIKAKLKFESVLKRNPNDAGTLYHLGILNEKLNKIPIAQEFYQRSIQAQPIQIESQMRLARISLKTNDNKQAEKFLKKAFDKVKQYPDKEQPTDKYFLYFYLGWLDYNKKDYESAYTHLKTSFFNENVDNQILSVRSGDVVCLLAETSTILKKEDSLTLWSECFRSPTTTAISNDIKNNRMHQFINTSIK